MDIGQHNKNVVRNCLEGRIGVRIFDEAGELKRVAYGSNIITTAGLNRLADMLIDGYNQDYPLKSPDFTNPLLASSTLKDQSDFHGGMDGVIFGLNFIPWPGRCKSAFNAQGFINTSYFTNVNNMFNNSYNSYSRWYADYQENALYTPSGAASGYYGCIADLGITNNNYDDGIYENFTAALVNTYYPVANKNLHYGSMVVKDSTKTTTYTAGVHYSWDTGDGDSYGTVKINSSYPELVGVPLKIQYTWHDVPQVPVCGFAIRAGGSSDWNTRSHFNAFRWSLNQGQSLTEAFFPNVNGNPSLSGTFARNVYEYSWNNNWNYIHEFHALSEPRTYFLNSLPWAVKNPTQISFHGNWYSVEKWVYDFQLLGLHLPKLGCHAIALGDGTGVLSSSRTDLFNRRAMVMTDRKARQSNTMTRMIGYLDYADGNGITYTEAGLFHPSTEENYFTKDEFYSGQLVTGGYGRHSLSGSNKILKLQPLKAAHCDAMTTHATFATPWSKTQHERAEIFYELNVNWGI